MNILKFGITTVVVLLVLELFLRTTEIAPTKYTRIDDTLGLVFRPNAPLLLLNEGFYLGNINAAGYLGPVRASSEVKRVVLLGDSYVEAFQVFERDHFATLTQAEFDQKGWDIQLENRGMSGFDLGQMYCRYLQTVVETTPELTVFFMAPEDFAVAYQVLSPMPQLTPEGALRISYPLERNSGISIRKQLENNFIYTSSTFTLLSNCRKLVAEGQWRTILFDKLAPTAETVEGVPNKETVAAPPLSDLAIKILEDLAGKPIAFATLKPYPPALRAQLKKLNFPIIDLMPEVDALRKQGIDPQYWEATNEQGHYNQQGHAAISQSLVRQLPALITN